MNQRTQNDKRGGDFTAAASIHMKRKDTIMTEERKRIYEEYRVLGMTEKQIEAIKEFDEGIEKSNREINEHTVLFIDFKKHIRRAEL